jgi:hypothetical protein
MQSDRITGTNQHRGGKSWQHSAFSKAIQLKSLGALPLLCQ